MVLTNNYPVNRTDFRIIRGVQNEILFFVRDLDRNPAPTTTFQQVTINIVDTASSVLLMSRNLTIVNAASALYMLTILAAETADWELGPLRWSIAVTRADGTSVMLWTDMNYGPYSMLEMTEGPIPGPTVATVLSPTMFTTVNSVLTSDQLPGASQLGYQNGLQTFAVYPSLFSGSLEIDGTLARQPNAIDWFPISTANYVLSSTLNTINVTGNYLWLRVRLPVILSGTINQILYKY